MEPVSTHNETNLEKFRWMAILLKTYMPQSSLNNNIFIARLSVAEFKEFKRRFKFKPRFKYGWFHLKFY